MLSRTLCIIKPDAVEKRAIGAILDKISQSGFNLIAMKMKKITGAEASEFYAEHRGKAFFDDLIKYMTSGPVTLVALEKENAVADFRTLIGKTDPAEAAEGTIRKLFAESKERNAVHGSDSDASAARELGLMFSESDYCVNR